MAKPKTITGKGMGWHKQSLRHSRARKYGKAGGRYASEWKKTVGVLVKKTKILGYNITLIKLPSGNMSARVPMGTGADQKMFDQLVYYKQHLYTGKDEEKIKNNIKNFIKKWKTSKDTDKDKVPDIYDCEPFNPKKQHKITRIKYMEKTMSHGDLAQELSNDIFKLGYNARVTVIGNHLELGDVRLNDQHIDSYGYNLSPYTGRRGRILNWDDWVKVNNQINKTLDKHKVSANIQSLAGKFKVRMGTKKYTEDDWEEFAYENVGSIINPVERRDAWQSEEKPRLRKKIPVTLKWTSIAEAPVIKIEKTFKKAYGRKPTSQELSDILLEGKF